MAATVSYWSSAKPPDKFRRVARRQDCDSHQKLVLIRSGALRLEILFEVSDPAPALFNGGRVDGSFRRYLVVATRSGEGPFTYPLQTPNRLLLTRWGRTRSGGLAFWTWARRQPRTGLPETSNRFNGGSTS